MTNSANTRTLFEYLKVQQYSGFLIHCKLLHAAPVITFHFELICLKYS